MSSDQTWDYGGVKPGTMGYTMGYKIAVFYFLCFFLSLEGLSGELVCFFSQSSYILSDKYGCPLGCLRRGKSLYLSALFRLARASTSFHPSAKLFLHLAIPAHPGFFTLLLYFGHIKGLVYFPQRIVARYERYSPRYAHLSMAEINHGHDN